MAEMHCSGDDSEFFRKYTPQLKIFRYNFHIKRFYGIQQPSEKALKRKVRFYDVLQRYHDLQMGLIGGDDKKCRQDLISRTYLLRKDSLPPITPAMQDLKTVFLFIDFQGKALTGKRINQGFLFQTNFG